MAFKDFFKKKDAKSVQKEEILEYVLSEGLKQKLPFDAERSDKKIIVSEFKMEIEVAVYEVMERDSGSAVHLLFNIFCGTLNQKFFEVSSGIAGDVKSATDNAIYSFCVGFCSGLKNLLTKEKSKDAESVFIDNKIEWNVYPSHIVIAGNENEDFDYWSFLQEDIMKRLGNKSCYFVKVFASKYGDSCNCEVRIDNEPIFELTEKLKESTLKWKNKEFLSHKQFFFIENKTSNEFYLYDGKDGEKALYQKIETYLKLFSEVNSQEGFDSLTSQLTGILGDKTLAEECVYFIPEICAEIAYGKQIRFSDLLNIQVGDRKIEVYLSQFRDFYPMYHCVENILKSNVLGEKTEKSFRTLVGMSASYSAIAQIAEKKVNPTGLVLTRAIGASEDFIIQ